MSQHAVSGGCNARRAVSVSLVLLAAMAAPAFAQTDPVFLQPTASDDLLGTGKWGIGGLRSVFTLLFTH